MVFLGKKRYTEDTMIWECLKKLAEGRDYARYLHLSDEVDEIVEFIKANPPLKSGG